MTARRAKTGGQCLHSGDVRIQAVNRLQTQGAVSQRAGLVDHQRGQIGEFFEERRAANQNPVTRGDGDTGNRRGRRRQHQRTRTRRHQHREHRLCIMGDEPGHRRQQQDQHHVAAGIAFEQSRDRRFRALGVLHQGNDFAQSGFVAGASDFDAQQSIEVDRAAEHQHADARFHRNRLTGNRRGIKARLPR